LPRALGNAMFDDDLLDELPEGESYAGPPELTYFNAAGRGEITRLALHAGNIAFKDNRIEGDDWPKIKGDPNSIPAKAFGYMPVIVHGEHLIAQSLACAQYAADLGMNESRSKTPQQRSMDMMMLAAREEIFQLTYRVVFAPSDKAREVARKSLPGQVEPFLAGVERMLKGKGPLLYSSEAEGPSLGDLAVFDLVTNTGPGLRGVDLDLDSSKFPKIEACVAAVKKSEKYPGLKKYIQKRGF